MTTEERITRERMMEKIKKLLALSHSPNQHEAELAAERASSIMAKYQIEMAEVIMEGIESGADPIIEERYDVPNLRSHSHYAVSVAYSAAHCFGGMILSYQPGVGATLGGRWAHNYTRIVWVGRREQVDAAKVLFEHLWRSWQGMVKVDGEKQKEKFEMRMGGGGGIRLKGAWTSGMALEYKQGHGMGFASSIWDRCRALKREREEMVMRDAGDGAGKALVVADGKLLEEWKKGKRLETAHVSPSTGMSSGIWDGIKRGREVDLGVYKKVEGTGDEQG